MALTAQHVSFSYSVQAPILFDQLDFKLETGQKLGLFGDSGIGKSSFARMLAGYEEPLGGDILLDGQPFPQKSYCPVQLIHQHPENTFNPVWTMKKSLEEAQIKDPVLLQQLGIQESWLSRTPNELSGGEKQRFAIARALHPDCHYLICDEITTMLDALTQVQIWQAVLKIAQDRNLALLVISHDMPLLQALTDDIYQFERHSIHKIKDKN